MSDLIDRQTAIDAVKRLSLGETDATRLVFYILDYLERMTSPQPEPCGNVVSRNASKMTDGTIINAIGEPALLEQTAEESIEFAHACQKLARKLRGENPTPVSIDECRRNVLSEWADVDVCITELTRLLWWDDSFVSAVEDFKTNRWEGKIA